MVRFMYFGLSTKSADNITNYIKLKLIHVGLHVHVHSESIFNVAQSIHVSIHVHAQLCRTHPPHLHRAINQVNTN